MNALREFIDAQGLSLAEAARISGVNPVNVHRHYHGERRISSNLALRYHRAFGIPLVDLLAAPTQPHPDEAA